MESFSIDLTFFKVDKNSTYEGLLKVLGKDSFVACLDEENLITSYAIYAIITLISHSTMQEAIYVQDSDRGR